MMVSLNIKFRGFLEKPRKNDLKCSKNSLKTQGFSRILEKSYYEASQGQNLKSSNFENESSNRYLRSRVFEGNPRKKLKFRGEVEGSIFDVFDHPNGNTVYIQTEYLLQKKIILKNFIPIYMYVVMTENKICTSYERVAR